MIIRGTTTSGRRAYLQVVSTHDDLETIVVRLVGVDTYRSGEAVVSVKEQEVTFVPPRHANHPRLFAYVLGWAQAVSEALDASDAECRMPADFIRPNVLDLKTPTTPRDFQKHLWTRIKERK